MAKSVARRCPARWSWSQVTSQWWLLSWPIFDVKWMEVPWVCWGCYVFPISGGPAKRLIPSIPSILQCLQCFLISHMKQQLEMKNIVSGLDFGLIWAIWAILCVTWHQSSSSFIIKHYINQKPPRKFWGGVFFAVHRKFRGRHVKKHHRGTFFSVKSKALLAEMTFPKLPATYQTSNLNGKPGHFGSIFCWLVDWTILVGWHGNLAV